MKKFRFAALFLALVMLAACLPAGATTYLSIATGGSGAVYYPLGEDIAKLFTSSLKSVEAYAQVSGGSVQNLRLLDAGMVELAMVQNDQTAYAYEGEETFTGAAMDCFSVIASLYTEAMQIIVSADSGIETVEDLRGKRVSVGEVGSSVYTSALQVLETAGIGEDEIETFHLGYSDAGKAIARKSLDAFFCTASIPSPAIVNMIQKNGARVISLSAEQVAALTAEHSFYVPYTIPAGTYKGQTEPIETFGVTALLLCRRDLDAELVYKMVKALYEKGGQKLTHAKSKEIRLTTALSGVGELPVHPGAAKYYTEAGILSDAQALLASSRP